MRIKNEDLNLLMLVWKKLNANEVVAEETKKHYESLINRLCKEREELRKRNADYARATRSTPLGRKKHNASARACMRRKRDREKKKRETERNGW